MQQDRIRDSNHHSQGPIIHIAPFADLYLNEQLRVSSIRETVRAMPRYENCMCSRKLLDKGDFRQFNGSYIRTILSFRSFSGRFSQETLRSKGFLRSVEGFFSNWPASSVIRESFVSSCD